MRILLSGCFLVAFGLLSCSSSSSSSPGGPPIDAGPGTVLVGPNASYTFAPSMLTVHVGDTVTWKWMSDHHTVTSGTSTGGVGTPDNKFCSPNDQNCSTVPPSNTGAVYTHTFTAAGTYPYFCFPHVGAGMTGTIIVQ